MQKSTVLFRHKLIASIALFVIFLATACTKNNSEEQNHTGATTPIPIQNIQDCHNSNNPYPSQITNNIVGTWQWDKSYAPMLNKTTVASKHLVIHINDASTYEIFENGLSITTGIWKISKDASDQWAIDLSRTNEHITGSISLCNNELLLSTAHIDGPINYFVRK